MAMLKGAFAKLLAPGLKSALEQAPFPEDYDPLTLHKEVLLDRDSYLLTLKGKYGSVRQEVTREAITEATSPDQLFITTIEKLKFRYEKECRRVNAPPPVFSLCDTGEELVPRSFVEQVKLDHPETYFEQRQQEKLIKHAEMYGMSKEKLAEILAIKQEAKLFADTLGLTEEMKKILEEPIYPGKIFFVESDLPEFIGFDPAGPIQGMHYNHAIVDDPPYGLDYSKSITEADIIKAKQEFDVKLKQKQIEEELLWWQNQYLANPISAPPPVPKEPKYYGPKPPKPGPYGDHPFGKYFY